MGEGEKRKRNIIGERGEEDEGLHRGAGEYEVRTLLC